MKSSFFIYTAFTLLLLISCSSGNSSDPLCETENTFSVTVSNTSNSDVNFKCILNASSCDYRCDETYVITPNSSLDITFLGERRHNFQSISNPNNLINNSDDNGIWYEKCDDNIIFSFF